MYKVSMLEPDKTERTQKLMTTNEIMKLPGGTRALKKHDSFSWSYSSNSSITILRALHFNLLLDDYTVIFRKPGETKQTEQIMKTAEVLTLRGGFEAIENYNQLQQKHARVLSVFDFNSVLDNYKVNIMEPGAQKTIQKTMTASDILNLQFGVTAIANYKKLHSTTAPQFFGLFNFNAALDNYTVNMLQPGETERIQKLMTTSEIRTLPGGPKAIHDYKRLHPTLTLTPSNKNLPPILTPSNKNLHPTLTPPTLTPSIDIQQLLSTVPERPLKNLYIVQFNKDQDNYTVSFNETGKRKKTEKMLTRLELLNMQGELPLSFPLLLFLPVCNSCF
jgi:hypothetical protein